MRPLNPAVLSILSDGKLSTTRERRGESRFLMSIAALSLRCFLHSITVRSGEVPEKYVEAAKAKRAELVESLAEVDDEIAEAWLEEREIKPEEFVVSITCSLTLFSNARQNSPRLCRLRFDERLLPSSSLQSSWDPHSPTNPSKLFSTVSVSTSQLPMNPSLSL